VLGELVHTTAGMWITRPPTRCHNGHPLGPGEVLVGHQACLGHGGGHTTWTCRTCDAVVYGPPLNSHCNNTGRAGGGADFQHSTRRQEFPKMSESSPWKPIDDEYCDYCGQPLWGRSTSTGIAQSGWPARVDLETRCVNEACPGSRL
jgi:hypothetical protein